MKLITIGANEAGQRLDKFLNKYLDAAGKGFLYKMLRKKNITLNGKKAEGMEMLHPGDEVRLFLSDETIAKFHTVKQRETAPAVSLDIIYEDRNILLINKPAGMLSQKARPEDISLCEYLTEDLLRRGELTEEGLRAFRPGVCNRLDRNTSGLVAAGKSLTGLQVMSRLLRERCAGKYYLAIVSGTIAEKTGHQAWLKKDEKTNQVTILSRPEEGAERIETKYEPLDASGGYTLLRVHLLTGKTHQIRAHLAYLGHPLAGDRKYGRNARTEIREPVRQMLHSYELVMPANLPELPELAGKNFFAAPPADFRRFADTLGLKLPEKTQQRTCYRREHKLPTGNMRRSEKGEQNSHGNLVHTRASRLHTRRTD